MPRPPEEVFFLSNGRVAFERAWIVLKLRKAPIVEPIPGVKVGYQAGGRLDQSGIVPEQVIFGGRAEEEIGNVPYASSADSKMTMMSPNEYFDTISPYTDAPIQGGRNDEYRWAPKPRSKETIDWMTQGIKEGKMIGAPTLGYGGKPGYDRSERKTNDKAWGYSGSQEGGHRMETLRQMGHGDKPIPVLQQRNFHVGVAPMRDDSPPLSREEKDAQMRRFRYMQTRLPKYRRRR